MGFIKRVFQCKPPNKANLSTSVSSLIDKWLTIWPSLTNCSPIEAEADFVDASAALLSWHFSSPWHVVDLKVKN